MSDMRRAQPVTILQLSDIHFADPPPVDAFPSGTRRELIEAFLADLDAEQVRPDLVVVSGDLTSKASRSEFDRANEALRRLAAATGLSIDAFVVVPGNHDVQWTADGHVTSSEYETFASRFYDVPVDRTALRSARVRDVYVLGLDSTKLLHQKLGGYGLVGDKQLDTAAAKVRNEATTATTRILVLHHHLLPVEPIPHEPAAVHSLTLDAVKILKWAQEQGFSLILHGHQHRAFAATFHNPMWAGRPLAILGAPSAGALGPYLPPQARNGIQLLRIVEGGIRRDLRYLTGAGDLEPGGTVEFVRQLSGVFASTAVPVTQLDSEPTTNDIRSAVVSVANAVTDLLSRSYGPSGGYRATVGAAGGTDVRDGLSILTSSRSANGIEVRILSSFVEAASELSDQVGDGRKTMSLVLAHLLRGFCESIRDGADEHALVASLRRAGAKAAEVATTLSERFDERHTADVVLTACADEDIASAIAEAVAQAGPDGVVTTEVNVGPAPGAPRIRSRRSPRLSGVRLPDWYAGRPAELERPYVLVYEGQLGWSRPVEQLFEVSAGAKRPLLIACMGTDERTDQTLALNAARGGFIGIPVSFKGHRFSRRHLSVLSLLSGARHINSARGEQIVADPPAALLGTFQRVSFENEELAIEALPGTAGEAWRAYVAELRTRIADLNPSYERDLLCGHLAEIVGAILDVTFTSPSEADGRLVKSRVRDGLAAFRAASREGTVKGGGVTYAAIGAQLRSEATLLDVIAFNLLADALDLPSRLLAGGSTEWPRNPRDALAVVRGVIRLSVDAATRILLTRSVELPGSS